MSFGGATYNGMMNYQQPMHRTGVYQPQQMYHNPIHVQQQYPNIQQSYIMKGNMGQQHGYPHPKQQYSTNYPAGMSQHQRPMYNHTQMYSDPNANAPDMIRTQRPQTRWHMNPQANYNSGYSQSQNANVCQTSPNLSPVNNSMQQHQQIPISNAQHPMHPYQQVQNRRRMSSSSQHSDYSTSSGISSNRNEGNWQAPTLNPTPPLKQSTTPRYIPANQDADSLPSSQISPNPIPVNSQWEGNNTYSSMVSPASNISSENSPTSTFQQPMRPFDAVQFRQPRPPPLMAGIPLQQLPPSGYMGHIPGAVAGTKGNDWEVECMGANAKLRNYELWKHFDNVVMEMVISKHGRRMFPVLEYDLTGLHPQKLYSVFVDFVLCSNYVWKFVEQKWQASGLAPLDEDAFERNHRICVHPDSPAPGDVWNKRGVTFSKMKLSNHLHSDGDKLSLKSLHKYQPRLHVVEVNPRDPTVQSNLRTFIVPKTAFMTVTLYHNTDVAQLKINLNPFARCFRDKELPDRSPSAHSPNDLKLHSPYSSSPSSGGSGTPSPNQAIQSSSKEPLDGAVIYKVSNPVSGDKLNQAKDFMQTQIRTMSELVQCQNLRGGNETSLQPVTSSAVTSVGITMPPFNRELEDLLSNVESGTIPGSADNNDENIDELKRLLADTNDSNITKVGTVHHKPLNGEEVKKTNTTTITKQDSKETYELSQVDRVFPPNAVAPVSTQLPFNPDDVKHSSERASKEPLPAFFECTYYREQAAQAQLEKNTKEDSKQENPVVYIPTSNSATSNEETANATEQNLPEEEVQPSLNHNSPSPIKEFNSPEFATTTRITEVIESHSYEPDSNQHSPLPQGVSMGSNFVGHIQQNVNIGDPASNMFSFPLPALSPGELTDFLGSDEMSSGNKRKFSYDDDDDVFIVSDNLPMHNNYLTTVTKRQCIAANGLM